MADSNDDIGEEPDYSQMRGICDEPHWQEFIVQAGGELVAPLITRQGVKNADFLFREHRVVAELKILETEFLENENIAAKVTQAFAAQEADKSYPLERELERIFKAPLQRIINKANRQIKETKRELGLTGWRGVLIVVNDGFRGLPPGQVMGLCASILNGKSYSSCDAFIYQTNHLVELPDDPYAVFLWAPLYHPKADEDLSDFVNDLGRAWRRYAEAVDGPYDCNSECEYADLENSSVVTGPYRSAPYIGP